jgi:hypothetical protein
MSLVGPDRRARVERCGNARGKALAGVGYADFIYYDDFENFFLHAEAGNLARPSLHQC